ncbi:MAG TPA: YetF domain-containing protein [Pirellulaceae bacterium]|jgi:uncharacterized membrane protein YcaP (DUF421 family)|nr:YetF domain-containing protein [Pirellulaceae bacterium]
MLVVIADLSAWTLGLGEGGPAALQMAARTVVVNFAALALIRLGEKRFLGKNTAFDVIIGVMLGSLLSRAINDDATFVGFFVAGVVFVFLHWLLAVISFRFDAISSVFKGSERLLVKDGEVLRDAMRKSHIGEGDLKSALRRNGRLEDVERVKRAYLERSGDISVIAEKSEPRIIEIEVREGVQRVRFEWT